VETWRGERDHQRGGGAGEARARGTRGALVAVGREGRKRDGHDGKEKGAAGVGVGEKWMCSNYWMNGVLPSQNAPHKYTVHTRHTRTLYVHRRATPKFKKTSRLKYPPSERPGTKAAKQSCGGCGQRVMNRGRERRIKIRTTVAVRTLRQSARGEAPRDAPNAS